MHRSVFAAAALGAGLLGAATLGVHAPAAHAAHLTIAKGQRAPDFTLKDPAGNSHKLSDYRGKVVVLDFWATWCGPCKAAMPGIQKLHADYEARGVKVFGMNVNDDAKKAEKFMADKKYTYTLLLNADSAGNAYRVRGIPAFFVIGPDGTIAFAGSGADEATHKAILKAVEEELAKVGT